MHVYTFMQRENERKEFIFLDDILIFLNKSYNTAVCTKPAVQQDVVRQRPGTVHYTHALLAFNKKLFFIFCLGR